MEILSATSPHKTKDGGVNLIVEFEGIGLVPFHATADDREPIGVNLYERAIGGEFGAVSPYVEPPVLITVPQSITPRQGKLVLLSAGILDDVEAYIDSIPGDQGKAARISFDYATEYLRDDPLLVAVATARGLSSEQIDQMFISGALL